MTNLPRRKKKQESGLPKRREKTRTLAKSVKSSRKSKKGSRERSEKVEFFTSGSTMLNLALTGLAKFGWPRARVSNIVGDGSSGKTLLALEIIFWFLKLIYSMKSKIFGKVKKAKVVYNNGEGVMDFPLKRMYGEKFEKMITWRRSKTIESAGRDFLEEADKLKKGESLLYIIDSWDSFRSIHDNKIRETKDEDIAKSMKLKKQQFAWQFFADVCEVIESNRVDATLIIISQTKSRIGVSFGKKQYRSGGDALNFYTHLVPWIRVIKKLSKQRLGEYRVYGTLCGVNVERSKVGPAFNTQEFVIIRNHGLSDIMAMANYLRKHKINKWKGLDTGEANWLKFAAEVKKRGLEDKLSRKVERIWNRVEEAFDGEIDELGTKEL